MASKVSSGRTAYLHPTAFDEARDAFGGEDVAELLRRFEPEGQRLGCSHLSLAACLHHFLSLGPVDRQILLVRYLDAIDPRRAGAHAARHAAPSRNGRGHTLARGDRSSSGRREPRSRPRPVAPENRERHSSAA